MSGTQTSDTKLALPSHILCIMISSFNVLRVLLSLDTYLHIVDGKASSLQIPERIFNNIIRTSQQINRPFLLNYIRWAERLSKNLVKSVLVCGSTMTKYYRPGGSINRNLFSHSFGDWKSKIKAQQVRFLVGALFLAWRRCLLPVCTHSRERRHPELSAVCSCKHTNFSRPRCHLSELL